MDDYGSRPGALSGAAAPATAATTDADAADAPAAHPFATGGDARYEVRARLGQGGMGKVELAFDRRLLREVALKVPRHASEGAEAATDDSARRLAQEAWITAQLDHPGIVPVYDAGRGADGELYYTMRVIRGRSLEEELAAAPEASARMRFLRHVLTACEAVAYAHKLGIVHRDLKPQNVLVGELGETQVADWGVARPTASAAGTAWREAVLPEGHAVETLVGGVVGTPAYMSPEQSVGAPPDPRADVWSLGAILFRLLAGEPPFGGATASEVLERVRHAPLPALPPGVPRELLAIVRHALDRDATRRYPSARELAADLASWLDGRRVSVHSYTPLELARRLVRAWRVPLMVAAVAFVVLVVGAVVAVDSVVDERDRALAAERAATRALAGSLVVRAMDEAARGQWPEAEHLAARALAEDPDHPDAPRARGLLMAADRARPSRRDATALPCAPRAVAPSGEAFVCGVGTLALWPVGGADARWVRPIDARFVAFAGDGRVIVVDRRQQIHTLDAATGDALGAPRQPQGAHGLAAGAGWAMVFRGWQVQRLDASGALGPPERVCERMRAARLLLVAPGASVGARPDLVVGCDDGNLAWAPAAGAWTSVATGLGADAIGLTGALAPDRRRLALINDKGALTVLTWPAGAAEVRRDTGIRGARALAWSPDGARLAIASAHGATRVLDAASGHELARLPHGALLAAWQGDALVTWSATRRERWDLPAALVAPLVGAEGPHREAGVATLAVGDDGGVVVGRGAGQIDRYAPDGTLQVAARHGDQTVKSLSYSADGRTLVAALTGGDAALLDAVTLAQRAALAGGPRRRAGALADGSLVVAGWTWGPAIFDATGAERVASDRAAPAIGDLDVAPDRTWAALLEESTGRLLVTNGAAFTPVGAVPGGLAVAARGDEIAVVTADAAIVVGRDGLERARFALATPGLDVAFAPDGRHLAIAHVEDAVVHTRDGRVVAVLTGHAERVAQLASTAEALYTASWDGTVRRWAWDALTRAPAELAAAAAARWGL